MWNISKEILRNYINEQNVESPDEVLVAIKEMFKDVLQEALEIVEKTEKLLNYNYNIEHEII